MQMGDFGSSLSDVVIHFGYWAVFFWSSSKVQAFRFRVKPPLLQLPRLLRRPKDSISP
jgi:hypothetical protein